MSAIALVVFVGLVAWVTVTRHDVQTGHNARSASHPHPVPVLAAEPD